MAAAVTIDSGYPLCNVNGSYREWFYIFDIAADGDWLDVPCRGVQNVTFINDTDTNHVAVASVANQGYGARVTFDTAGAVTNVYCRVTGR